jgi:hypothetical protein
MNTKNLLVGVAVAAVLAGGGYAGWIVYNERQAYADTQRRQAEDYSYRAKHGKRDANRPNTDDTLGAWRNHFGK